MKEVELTVGARLSNGQLRLLRRYPRAFALVTRLRLLVPARWGRGRDVALVRALQPAPDVDMPLLFRDDEIAPSVLVLYRNFGRLEGSAEEGKTDNAAIWSFRDGRLARAAFYIDRAEALKAVGLE